MPDLSISVVTPTLNAERFLPECLASVRAQNWPTLWHLVVDGGSNDRTRQLVLESGAAWLSRPGSKQSAAINVGLGAAPDGVVSWLNADDLYTPGTIAYVAECFASEPDLDVLVGDCQVIDATGKPLWSIRPGPYDFGRLLRTGNSMAQPAVFLRKRVFEAVGYLDESLDFGMDYELWLRLEGCRVDYVPRVLAAFRWHSDSKTATHMRASWREVLAIVRRHGGGWTPALAWSYMRARQTLLRHRMVNELRHRHA
jgi:glycosyltransferase involved in cell wall biosynthesis